MLRNFFLPVTSWISRLIIRPGFMMTIVLMVIGGCGRPKMSIILVTLDTTRADRLGCYGYRAAYTPTLDSLASHGVLFERAYSPVPLTLPAHATILTGLQPWEHGVRDNGFYRLPDSLRTLTMTLHDRSYWCAAVIGAYPLITQYGLAGGFDVYDDGIPLSGEGAFYPERKAPEVTDRALLLLESRPRNRPAFLWVHYFDPHYPYEDCFPGLTGYDAEVALMDRELGRLLKHLSSDLWSVIVVGDHGEGLWDHGEQTHGDKLYNTTLHVPLIICGPGWRGGRIRTEPVTLADLEPTILSIAGGRGASPFGVSLFSNPDKSREIRAETVHPQIRYGWAPLRSVQIDSMKFIAGEGIELYNVFSDPFETRNIMSASATPASYFAEKLPPAFGGAGVYDLKPDARRALQALGYIDEERNDNVSKELILRWIDKGSEFLGAGRYAEADSIFRLILTHDPGNRKAHVSIGVCAMQTGNYDTADSIFSRLYGLFPDYLPVKEGLAEAAFRKRQYERAEELYGDILELFPDHIDALLWLAVINRMQGEYDTSRTYYERYIRLVPDNVGVLKDFSVLLGKYLNDPERAIRYRDRARALENN